MSLCLGWLGLSLALAMCAWEQVSRAQWRFLRLHIFPEGVVAQKHRLRIQGGGNGPLGHTSFFQSKTVAVVFSKLGEVLVLQYLWQGQALHLSLDSGNQQTAGFVPANQTIRADLL